VLEFRRVRSLPALLSGAIQRGHASVDPGQERPRAGRI